MALVRPSAISHWSALNYHGMTEQVPRKIFVLTTAKSLPRLREKKISPPHGGYPVGSATYQFVQIKPIHYFGIKDIWVNDEKIKITDNERTLLDCLMFPEYAGGFFEVLHTFERNIEKINIEKIVEYALKLDTVTIKRLGWILSSLGIDSLSIKPLKDAQIKGYRLLDKTGPHEGKYNAQWMILENLSGNAR
jgi:predicted transcriptional regulator of viral defense system